MNQHEQQIFFFLTKRYSKLPVLFFTNEPMGVYEQAIKKYKGKGFIGIFPPFIFEGRTCYNDFSVYLPSGKLVAIECKQRNKVIDLTYIQEKISKTKNIVEDKIIYLFDGLAFTKKTETIKQFKHNKSEIIYDLDNLLKVA